MILTAAVSIRLAASESPNFTANQSFSPPQPLCFQREAGYKPFGC